MSNAENNKRIVLVTGATGGLGTAMCKKLLKESRIILALLKALEETLQQVQGERTKIFSV